MIADAYAQVEDRVREAARMAGRNPKDITLIAVSKTKPLDAVLEAYAAGARDFGENYAQELADKSKALGDRVPNAHWHFIGRFQKNKINGLKHLNPVWHTLDSLEDVKAVAARQPNADVLLQVNIGDEPQKGGAAVERVPALLELCAAVPHVKVRGLMTIPPVNVESSRSFAALAELVEKHRGLLSVHGSPWVSMGMSEDFTDAIRFGATHVRVGSLIFGARAPLSAG
jgi:pyridoxal phosphate enzyme (YggS family)